MTIKSIIIIDDTINQTKLTKAKYINNVLDLHSLDVNYENLTQSEKDVWDAFVNLVQGKVPQD